MKTTLYRVICNETDGILSEGSRARVEHYLDGLIEHSPNTAATCAVYGLDTETGKWTPVAARKSQRSARRPS